MGVTELRISESRRFQFLDEIVDSIARRARREKFLHWHSQYFREIKQRFVVNV
jgi:hypothetical protein